MTGVVARRGAGALENLERVDPGQFPALYESVSDLKLSLSENLGQEGLALTDLPRIPIPSGKSTTWEIPDPLGGKPEPASALDALLTFWSPVRVWWPKSEDDGDTLSGLPPECSSTNGKNPLPGGAFAPGGLRFAENPGGSCESCPMSKFGTAKTGRGQACSDRRAFFLLFPDALLPSVVSLPPTSAQGAVKSFMRGLGMKYPGVHYSGFQFRFELEKTERNGNIYVVVKPSLLGVLEGVRPESKGGPVEGTPAHLALTYSIEFGKLLDTSTIVDVGAGGARDDFAAASGDDDFGGDFADHGEVDGP